jgi:TIR domain-containing protein
MKRKEAPPRKGRVDFFISYTKADEQWAEWIAWTLNEAGYSHFFQKWHFTVGGDFVQHMDEALKRSDRVLMVLTPDYLASMFAQSEWMAGFAMDPSGQKGILVPVRVAEVELQGLLKSRVYCDLVGLGDRQARKTLLGALRGKAAGKPKIAPVFPAAAVPVNAQTRNSYDGIYPGPDRTRIAPKSRTRAAGLELKTIFDTTGTMFVAQIELRDLLVAHIERRLRTRRGKMPFEAFFNRHFSKYDAEELRLHRTIRAYTESTLAEYNARALELIERHPALAAELPSSFELRRHLQVWLSKFQNVFRVTPSMSLLYVGPEERVPFPEFIEDELARYLAGGRRPRAPGARTIREIE